MSPKQEEDTTVVQQSADEVEQQQLEAEYRRTCRKFYRQSTSIISDDDEDLSDNDHHGAALTKIHRNPTEAQLVLEAIDRLAEGGPESYATFLMSLQKDNDESQSSPSKLDALVACGLPLDPHSKSLTDPTKLQRWMAIRTEERQLAHERNIRERLQIVQQLLFEQYQQQFSRNRGDDATPVIITTKEDLRRIRQTVQNFVQTYAKKCVASHPLLAGMRRLLEQQLQSTSSGADTGAKNDADAENNGQVETPVCLLWNLDAAVMSEAVVAQEQGASDAYVRQAIATLTCFLVWIPNNITRDTDDNHHAENDKNNKNQVTLTFAIQPSLSDRTLEMILQVLPPVKELHARPTGTISIPPDNNDNQRRMVRENVDGEFDELDVCTVWFHNAMRWYQSSF